METIPTYNDLSDFVSKTVVCINNANGKAVVVVAIRGHQPISLIGFEADPGKTDFEIKEEGWNYLQVLKEQLGI